MLSKGKILSLIFGPILFVLIFFLKPFSDLSPEANAVLASTVWIALWWITEAIPIPATSLLPLILFPLTGALDIQTTGAAYGDKLIFLFMGGFFIAIAIEKWNLHKRIALTIIVLIGTDLKKMVLGFMLATGFLSMWISNTATAVMMLPIGVAIIKQLKEGSGPEGSFDGFSKVLMLSIAYAASIGGISTLIGTPPNLVLAGVVEEFYDIKIDFGQWMLFAFPLSLTLLLISWWYLVRVAHPLSKLSFPGGTNEISRQLKLLGKVSFEEKMVLVVFSLTAFAWISKSFLLVKIFPAIDDSIIALTGAMLLFVLPAKHKDSSHILNWTAAKEIPWGIILLFGGGLAIAEGFKVSGLATWIAGSVSQFQGISLIFLLLIAVALINFLTEITSNVATTAMVLPVIAPIALSMDVHPFGLLFGTTIAASCAFMLPVATPPNAVVFGSDFLKMKDMVKAGFALNIISIVLIILYIYFILPLIWDLDLHQFPEALK